MQNKGAVKLLAIALALVSIYQLSFTYITYKVEREAAAYAQGDPAREEAYLDSMMREVVYNFLGIRQYTYREAKEREINLGLDLRGGMNVTLEVSSYEIIRALSNYSTDPTFVEALNLAREWSRTSTDDFITLFGRAFETVDPNAQLAAIFSTVELRDRVSYNSTNQEVMSVIRRESERAIDNSFNILRSRIDRFGVAQPNIQRLETHGRILVELPGVKEPERVRSLLQGTANLEFWETYENSEIYPFLLQANERIKEIEEARRALSQQEEDPVEEEDDLLVPDQDLTPADQLVTDEESLLDLLDQDTLDPDRDISVDQMMVDFPLFSILNPSTTPDGQLMPGSSIGIADYRDTTRVNNYLNMPQVRQLFPRDVRFYWGVKPPRWDATEAYYELHAIKVTSRDGRPPLDGDVITDARVEFGQAQATAEVTMAMNAEGARIWARLTRDNIGRCIAIVLDDYVYSAPRVNQEITGGRSQITGDFSITEAQDLANVLRSGALPAPARIIQEAIVGPTLGQEAVRAGLSSFIIAFLVVLLYMVIYYSRKAGIVADIALIVNVFFIMGVLASLGATLTLPGIAGIVLTIGMSVDANVLIFERIREEIKAGKGLRLAVSDGYKNAYSAIIDANVTTLLTGIILYIFGTGPIQGFATTLVIGICTSLFSAIFITRLIFLWFLDRNKTLSFATKLTENAFKNVHIKFIEKRKIFYAISGIIIIIGIGSLFTRGLSQGIDFTGGRTYIVRFEENVSTLDIQNSLFDVFGEGTSVITFGGENQIRVSTNYRIDEIDPEVDEEVEQLLYQGLQPFLDEDVSLERFMSDYRQSSEKVGPAVAQDIKVQAVYAIVFALVIMFLYMFIRFKNWQFGLGAIAAVGHDVMIVLSIFSLLHGIMPFSLEIDQAFIAAILTVVGYSINDTVVVFDRIREFFKLYPKRERSTVYNLALNSTLSRTFSTSLSTFFVLLSIFLFGGEVIRGFIFALLIGVIVGTYSSLFIATPVVYDSIGKLGKMKQKQQKSK
ncbi:MAG: protein translocase subunit SecDF [Marinilabiliales bacterium]|nr:MAG: protein translocase subunit SecDF [Marinilabiliales bacterium]